MVGIWGKHPGRSDFIRWNAGDLSRLGFDRWFEDAFEMLVREGRPFPSEPTAFLFPVGAEAIVGVLAPSRDAVGRDFPLLIVATATPPLLNRNFPLFPLACSRFIEEATRLLRLAASAPLEAVLAQAEALDLVPWEPIGRNDFDAYLLGTELNELEVAMGDIPNEVPYAMSTLLQACIQSHNGVTDGGPANITIDAPAPSHGTAALWLELLRFGLGDTRTPTCLWVREGHGRLLASIGKPSTHLLSFAANPEHRHSSFWPLQTKVQSARDDARRDLSPGQGRVLSTPGATLADLIQAVRSER